MAAARDTLPQSLRRARRKALTGSSRWHRAVRYHRSMVTAEKWTSRPVTGCDQVLSARERSAVWSVPRAGGELKSEPTTENRNRAQRAPVELGVVWVITFPRKRSEGTVTSSIHRPRNVVDEHLLRVDGGQRETSICGPPLIVMGARNRSSRSQPVSGGQPLRKASTSE